MSYNICFTLGDPSGDGHANTSEYHIVATHSVEEITNAYKKTTELLGFDFVKEVGSEYEADGWIPQEYTKKLLELNIIDDEYITTEDHQYGPPCWMLRFGIQILTLQNVIGILMVGPKWVW